MKQFELLKLHTENMSRFSLEKYNNLDDIDKKLSEYNGMISVLQKIIHLDIINHILSLREAVQSSHIEGTTTTVTDILEVEIGNNKDDTIAKEAEEIKNYQEALQYGVDEINEKQQISEIMLRSIQKKLLNNSRGTNTLLGQYKQKDNYIGSRNKEILYIPPSHLYTKEYMENLLAYSNIQENSTHPIIKVAIIHAQFELIHPFEDGNGRTGRILIPLLLYKYAVLKYPYFYISDYFARYRNEYIGALERISINNDWDTWFTFFIKAMEQGTEDAIQLSERISRLYGRVQNTINDLEIPSSITIVNFLFTKIKFDTTYFIKKTTIQPRTAQRILNKLRDVGIIKITKKSSGSSSTQYIFTELYTIAQQMDEGLL